MYYLQSIFRPRVVTFSLVNNLLCNTVGVTRYPDYARQFKINDPRIVDDEVKLASAFQAARADMLHHQPNYGMNHRNAVDSKTWWFWTIRRTLQRAALDFIQSNQAEFKQRVVDASAVVDSSPMHYLSDPGSVDPFTDQIFTQERQYVVDQLIGPGFAPMFERIHADYGDAASWEPYAEVEATLAGLKNDGFTTGIVSNFDERLDGIVEAHGLDKLITFTLGSHAVGVAKPHRSLFNRILDATDTRSELCLHVGTDPDHDFWAPATCGISTMLLDRPEQFDEFAYGDRYMTSLAELRPLIADMRTFVPPIDEEAPTGPDPETTRHDLASVTYDKKDHLHDDNTVGFYLKSDEEAYREDLEHFKAVQRHVESDDAASAKYVPMGPTADDASDMQSQALKTSHANIKTRKELEEKSKELMFAALDTILRDRIEECDEHHYQSSFDIHSAWLEVVQKLKDDKKFTLSMMQRHTSQRRVDAKMKQLFPDAHIVTKKVLRKGAAKRRTAKYYAGLRLKPAPEVDADA